MAEQTKEDRLSFIARQQRSAQVIEEVGRTVRTLLVVGCVMVVVYLLYLTITATVAQLAGRQTEANLAVSFLTEFSVSVGLGWSVGAGGLCYGYLQSRLRKRSIAQFARRIAELELLVDPNRTSSHLTPEGDTNPGDK